MGIARARLGTVALAAALLTACGDHVGTADAGTDLEGSWHLLRGTDATGALDLPRRREITLELRGRDPAAGRCPDDVEAQHSHVVDVLRDGFTAEVDGRMLTVTNDHGLGLGLNAKGHDGAE